MLKFDLLNNQTFPVRTRSFFCLAGAVLQMIVFGSVYADDFTCPVTLPEPFAEGGLGGSLENDALWTNLSPYSFVFLPEGPGFVAVSDGALGIKQAWGQKRAGVFSIEGRRLDEPSEPLRAYIPTMAEEDGFHATLMMFPTPGCWEVVGRLEDESSGDASLTFVVLVLKIGNGPVARRDR